MTPNPRPPGRRRIDPAWVTLTLVALLLLGAVSWLMSGRGAPVGGPVGSSVRAQVDARLEAAWARLAAAEADIAALASRPPGDPAGMAALEGRITALGPAMAALGAARLEALETTLGARLASLEAALMARDGTAEQARTAIEERQASMAAQLEQARLAGEAGLGQRMTNLETGVLQRQAGLEASLAQRTAAIEQTLTQRLAPLEHSVAQRLALLEQALQRLGAAEARTEHLAGLDALRALLDAGEALGPALARLATPPPPALARFATVAPPTGPALRLGFDEAWRQARGAAPEGALPRLNNLFTIRRGDDLVWGDASEALVERARRALDAGDADGALGQLGHLPEPVRQGMRAWLEDARALSAARAALRALTGG